MAHTVLPSASCLSCVLPRQRSSNNDKLDTESLGSELHCASKQDALRDKLDDATRELAAEKKKCSDIVKQLSNKAKENKTLSVNLDDARQQMSEMVAVNDRLSRSIKDMETESKETQEFLTEECNAAMKSLQEAESETQNLHYMLNDKDEQCRRLLEELRQRDLYVQMLQEQLESTENRARDTLLSQGTEITGASLALSEISNRVKCVMKSTILGNSLSEEEVRKLCKANGIEEDTEHDGIVTNGNDVVHNNATSSVHSVLQAVKNSDNDNAGKYTDACDDDDINGQNFCDEIRRFATPFQHPFRRPLWLGWFTPLETIQEEDSATAEGSNDVDATEESSDVIRQVGFATPFQSISPLKPIQEEDSAKYELSNHGDTIETQINSVNVIISKFAVISSVVQDELKSQLKQLESDKKHLEKQLQNERSNKTETIIKLNNNITIFGMEISVLRGQRSISISAKNKLTRICDALNKTVKEFLS